MDAAEMDVAELDHLAPQLAVTLESVASIQGVAGDEVPPTSHPLPLTSARRRRRSTTRSGVQQSPVLAPAQGGLTSGQEASHDARTQVGVELMQRDLEAIAPIAGGYPDQVPAVRHRVLDVD
jgi:hypothetical protein